MPRPPRSAADRAVSLLLKAVRQLPPRDQDAILRYLLAGGAGGVPAMVRERPELGPWLAGSEPGSWGQLQAGIRTYGSRSPGAAQVVPVRLPEAQYRRLKEWCQGHNFAMAVVIRGLVDQFLERQGAGGPGNAPEEA